MYQIITELATGQLYYTQPVQSYQVARQILQDMLKSGCVYGVEFEPVSMVPIDNTVYIFNISPFNHNAIKLQLVEVVEDVTVFDMC